MAQSKVGKITHYYDKIEVAVVELTATLNVGDNIKIVGQEREFTQTVSSIQIEHQQLQSAKKGQIIGLKVDQPVKENYLVYKVG